MAKYQLSESFKSSLADLPEVLVFIEKLQKAIGRLKRRLKKLSTKRKKTIESSTQTEQAIQPKQQPQSIIEEIAEAAQEAVLKMGMVYEESSGLYYDYKTGYYYNAEYGLYYDGKTGTYMTYDAASDTYNFYSKVDMPAETLRKKEDDEQDRRDIERRPSRRRKRVGRDKSDTCNWNVNGDRRKRSRSRGRDDRHSRLSRDCPETGIDLEEGECSEDEHALVIALSENEGGDSESSETKSGGDGIAEDITKKYPPCIRVVVEETNIPSVRKGGLFLVPYTGGTLGREGTSHAIILPDINVSKHHLQFRYDEEQKRYLVCDLGSRNGTLLNGSRMAPSMQESDPMELVHGSKLQIASTILLCHIHVGAQTCGHCEPGLIQEDEAGGLHSAAPSKSEQHKQELKQLRKKFGISQYELGKVEPGAGYTNRAQTRRSTVGSSNPHEKTQVASLTESIPAQNKGFKMLAKMGWTEGTSLGKDGTGRVEPVALVSNPGTSGMGSSSSSISALTGIRPIFPAESVDSTNLAKPTTTMRWLKTKERFDKLPNLTTIRDKLDDADDSSS